MKAIRSLLQGVIVLAPMVALGQTKPQAAKDASAEPPVGIVEHRNWCDQADTPSERLHRLEEFWTTRLGECEGGKTGSGHPSEYEDGLELNYIRDTAYTLAEAYIKAGDKTGSAIMLHYLKWTDQADLWQSIGSPFYNGRAILKPGAPLSLSLLEIRAGFEVPECVWWDAEGQRAVVSNISSKPDEYWSDDGTFLVSDFPGNKVCAISADRKTVTTLIKLDTPADIGLDRENGVLFVPQLKHDRVVVLRLVQAANGKDQR